MAEANPPRVVISFEPAVGAPVRLATYQCATDSEVLDAPAPTAKAIEVILNYLQQDPGLGPPP